MSEESDDDRLERLLDAAKASGLPVDIATLAGDAYDDAWQAMAESYAMLATELVAVLQRVGPVTLPANYPERADGLVVISEPLPTGAWRCYVIPRDETGIDSEADAARLRAKWKRQYVRTNAEERG
jgi:hypothetical protein